MRTGRLLKAFMVDFLPGVTWEGLWVVALRVCGRVLPWRRDHLQAEYQRSRIAQVDGLGFSIIAFSGLDGTF